jgi:tRNA uracil 4-sulfurtransferase
LSQALRVVVRYHEIALKGRNRPYFVCKLAENLRKATADLPEIRVQPVAGRVSLLAPAVVSWSELRERIESVFGVANFSRVLEVPHDLDALKTAAIDLVNEQCPTTSFRVTTRRSWKLFPLDSGQVDREIGAAIREATGIPVNLEDPAVTLFVEVLKDRILVSAERLPGAGGFPVGSSGRVLALLSGGIDSPVAAARLLRRGCTADLVNFHAFPFQDRTMIDKATELAHVLTRRQFRTRLVLVPFGPVQQTIVASCPAPLRVVLYRRFMLRIAEALALRGGAKALVTGESLGQVASQTLENILVIDEAVRIPVLRPLIGMDKEEITSEARRLGTFEISTLPDQDCCQLFVPRGPATAAKLHEVRRAEEALDVPALVGAAIDASEHQQMALPALRSRAL